MARDGLGRVSGVGHALPDPLFLGSGGAAVRFHSPHSAVWEVRGWQWNSERTPPPFYRSSPGVTAHRLAGKVALELSANVSVVFLRKDEMSFSTCAVLTSVFVSFRGCQEHRHLLHLKYVLQTSELVTSSVCFQTRIVHCVNEVSNPIVTLSHSSLFDWVSMGLNVDGKGNFLIC